MKFYVEGRVYCHRVGFKHCFRGYDFEPTVWRLLDQEPNELPGCSISAIWTVGSNPTPAIKPVYRLGPYRAESRRPVLRRYDDGSRTKNSETQGWRLQVDETSGISDPDVEVIV